MGENETSQYVATQVCGLDVGRKTIISDPFNCGKALEIVKELAATAPSYYSNGMHICIFCAYENPSFIEVDNAQNHPLDCLWRRAVKLDVR